MIDGCVSIAAMVVLMALLLFVVALRQKAEFDKTDKGRQ